MAASREPGNGDLTDFAADESLSPTKKGSRPGSFAKGCGKEKKANLQKRSWPKNSALRSRGRTEKDCQLISINLGC